MKKSDEKFVDTDKAKALKLKEKAKAKAAKLKAKEKAKAAKLKAKEKVAKAKEKAKALKLKVKAKAAKAKAKAKLIKAKEKAKALKLKEKEKAKLIKEKAKNAKLKMKEKPVRKESVMVVDKDPKYILNAERDAIKTVLKNCKMHAKELAKVEDDETKQKMIAKLIKLGYSFDLSDPTKLSVIVNVGCTVVPKMKKLKTGAKAVAVEQPIEKPKPTEPIAEEKPTESPEVEESPTAEVVENTQPTEVPVGDTFTDAPIVDDSISHSNEPSDDELNEIEAEEDEQPNENPEDDLAEYRADFFGRLAEDGDDDNL